jgi:hypothetical protein
LQKKITQMAQDSGCLLALSNSNLDEVKQQDAERAREERQAASTLAWARMMSRSSLTLAKKV